MAGTASNAWWVVFYEPIGVHAPGSTPSLYQLVQATSKQAAEHKVTSQGAAVTNADGPFRTKAAAQAAATGSAGKTTTTPGAPSRSSTTNTEASGGADISLPNPLSGLAAIASALAKLVGYLSDGAMWRSLGWILLGIGFIIAGVMLWLRAEKVIPDVVPVPV